MQFPLSHTANLLRQFAAKRILLATHINPDGDALGSVAALGHIAASLGCDVRLLLVSGIPLQLSWLPLPWPSVSTAADLGEWTPALVIVADCGDAARPGPELEAFFQKKVFPSPAWKDTPSLCIDHHLHDSVFADHNWIDPAMASTGQMIGLLAEDLGLSLTGDLGRAVYLTLISDTGNFSFSNTTKETFAMAARIVAGGLNVAEFTTVVENNWTLPRMHLWGELLREVTLHANGSIALGIATQDALRRHGCTKDDLEGFAAWLRRIRGVRVAFFVREDGPALSKISLRSMGDIDVRRVAVFFGGGGHAAAAGAELRLSGLQTSEAVLAKLLEVIS